MKTNDPFNQKNKQPFEVPSGYFEALPTKIQEVLREEENKMTLWDRIKPILGGRFTISTSVMAVLVIVILQLSEVTTSTSNISINSDEAYAYLEDLETEDFDETMMLDYLDEIPVVLEEPTEEDIMNYLMNQEYIENEVY